MLEIDGAFGEGGGQILRTALSLSLLTGKPFRITNIRASRPKPGLRPQHLQAVEACAHISTARVEGAAPGSRELAFAPGNIIPGEYKFDIGTAGSVALLFQTLFLPLSLADKSSTLSLVGGTHVPWSPCYHYLEIPWLDFMRRTGFECSLELVRAGYYPRGGGELRADIHPASEPVGLNLVRRGKLESISGLSVVSNLPLSIAGRQKRQAEARLKELGLRADIQEQELPSAGKGTMLYLAACFEHSQVAYFGLGAIGKRAEQVADEACEGLKGFLESDACLDEHLGDQLLLPLAWASSGSTYTTCRITQHLLTNAYTIKQFVTVGIVVEGEIGCPGCVRIGGNGVD